MGSLRIEAVASRIEKYSGTISKVLTALIALGVGYFIVAGKVVSAALIVLLGVLLHFFLAHNMPHAKEAQPTKKAIRNMLEDLVALFFALSALALFSFDLKYLMLYIAIAIVLYLIFAYYRKFYEFYDEDTAA